MGEHIREVYLPLPRAIVGSGRPVQDEEHRDNFLRGSPFPVSIVVNPITLPRPVDDMAGPVISELERLDKEFGLAGVTVTNLLLAARIREKLPDLPLSASVLMDISQPNQAVMLKDICDTLVPSNRIMRNLPAIKKLRSAFSGRIRLLVNEACLPGCPYRVQHFHEMGGDFLFPHSLCDELLSNHPWMRLTGAWVLPQHLKFYSDLYDELKLAGRVTLQDPGRYRYVLEAYVRREPLSPHDIGGGPASVTRPMDITDDFFHRTSTCGYMCGECVYCREYWDKN